MRKFSFVCLVALLALFAGVTAEAQNPRAQHVVYVASDVTAATTLAILWSPQSTEGNYEIQSANLTILDCTGAYKIEVVPVTGGVTAYKGNGTAIISYVASVAANATGFVSRNPQQIIYDYTDNPLLVYKTSSTAFETNVKTNATYTAATWIIPNGAGTLTNLRTATSVAPKLGDLLLYVSDFGGNTANTISFTLDLVIKPPRN